VTSPTDRPSKFRLDLRAADSLAEAWRSMLAAGPVSLHHAAFLWETPQGERILAAGAAARVATGGPGRFVAARRWLHEAASARARSGASGDVFAICGFSFAETAASGWGVADAELLAPVRIGRVDAADRIVESSQPPGFDGSDPEAPDAMTSRRSQDSPRPGWSEDAWERAVGAALEEIGSGRIEKVVLARSREIDAAETWDLARVFHSMKKDYPSSYRFLVADGRGSTFLGASPERLVSLRQGRVEAEAVAGTTRVARDAGPEERARAAAALLSDPKERREHAVVLRDILAALEPYCTELAAEPEPSVDVHRHLLHLRTRVIGSARPGTHVLDLVARLHPTPAVAGAPRAAALEFIREWEPRERGWYAGPIGWVTAEGDGDFTVGLRSALVQGNRAILFGGAGIVAGSDPGREWLECDAKMQSILDALAHG
jgi:isochorismate synthase